jgi:hypothetical protein
VTYRIALAFLAAALSAYGQARVVSASGAISLKRAGRDLGRVALQSTVRPGDEITTGENAEAVIQESDGSTVRVFPDSRVVFQERTPSVAEWLHLFFGSVKVHIEKFSGRPNPHSMTTPTAVIAVRGTTFDVLVDDTDATMVSVDEGLVSVAAREAPHNQVLVRPGQRTWVRAGGVVQAAVRLVPDKPGNGPRQAPGPGPHGRGPKTIPPGLLR